MYEANKSLGQNFLLDATVAEKLVDELNVENEDVIIEVGAGLGAITEALARKLDTVHFTVYALEIDTRFIPKLESMFVGYQNLFIEEADVLKWLPKFTTDKKVKILGALPFYITSPIIHQIVKMRPLPASAVLIVQKEVGEKIVNNAPDASYLSTFVQSFFNVTYVSEVSRTMFEPQPNVDACILRLIAKTDAALDLNIDRYEGFLHRGFASPRKMLNKAFSPDELSKAGIDATLRPEAVSSDSWLNFFRIMNEIKEGQKK